MASSLTSWVVTIVGSPESRLARSVWGTSDSGWSRLRCRAMDVTTAMLADFAQVREGLLFVSSGGITRCYREQLPAPLGVHLAIVLELDRLEAERPHEVRVVVVDEDGGQLAEIAGEIQLGDTQLMVNENLNLPITFDLRNVPVERFGAVEVRCYVAAEHRCTLPLWVLQTPS